jgi:hypothetical protein
MAQSEHACPIFNALKHITNPHPEALIILFTLHSFYFPSPSISILLQHLNIRLIKLRIPTPLCPPLLLLPLLPPRKQRPRNIPIFPTRPLLTFTPLPRTPKTHITILPPIAEHILPEMRCLLTLLRLVVRWNAQRTRAPNAAHCRGNIGCRAQS